MFTLVDLVQPTTIEEAFKTLKSGRNNVVLGGCAFLKMSNKKIMTGIDLSQLKLNYIKEQDGYIEIGAMTTFRDIETSVLLQQTFNGLLPKSISQIIGVQFRNVVTVGASVYSKYGFSDLLAALLALDTEVELYEDGRMNLAEFLNRPGKKDILTRIFINKDERNASYQCLRNSASDFPILNSVVTKLDNQWKIAVGARPMRAELAFGAADSLTKADFISEETIELAAALASEELSFGTNLRSTAVYRKALCKVLVKRGIQEVLACKSV